MDPRLRGDDKDVKYYRGRTRDAKNNLALYRSCASIESPKQHPLSDCGQREGQGIR